MGGAWACAYLNPHDRGQHGRTAEDFETYRGVAAAPETSTDELPRASRPMGGGDGLRHDMRPAGRPGVADPSGTRRSRDSLRNIPGS